MESAAAVRRYAYVARNLRGVRVAGEISADSRASAYANLSERRGLTVVSLSETKTLAASLDLVLARLFFWYHGLTIPKAKLLFFRQMAKFMRHGMPIERALTTCATTSTNPRFREIVRVVTADMVEGRHPRFHEALAQHEEFSHVEVAMLRAGEGGAGFPAVLGRIEKLLARQRRISTKVSHALVYPAFVALGIVGFVAYTVVYFVPQFANIAGQFNQALPTGLVMLTRVGTVLASPLTLTLALLIVAIAVIAARAALAVPSIGYLWDAFWLRAYIVGQIRRKDIRSTFSRLYSSLMVAGVPIGDAFDLVIETTGSPVYRRALGDIRDWIKLQGGTFSEHAARTGWFDADYLALVGAGEQSASLADSFDTVADEDDADVDAMLDNLTTLLEPIMIALLGAVVALIVGIVYGSLYGMISKIK